MILLCYYYVFCMFLYSFYTTVIIFVCDLTSSLSVIYIEEKHRVQRPSATGKGTKKIPQNLRMLDFYIFVLLFYIFPVDIRYFTQTVVQFDETFFYFVDNRHFHPVAYTVEYDTQADNPRDSLSADIRIHEAAHTETCSQHTETADDPPVAETDTLEVKRTDSEVDTFEQQPEGEDKRQSNHQRSRMEDHDCTKNDL